ncbi:hypothetical protein [Variovorax sp. J22R115]|uniref:hypothetical protein n=1 Tax=Variovorax sp. J22R115 TaxID=3053509 RepID=UPI0025754294|nr:hypothetical protein [Variovorax sp. J22R115]MDM0053010.1 hypothetical protein [Variovorax sp. J22R115]
MRKTIGICIGSAALMLAGCSATNPPLMFGDAMTFGLRLGNDGSTGGGSVALGYKAQSVAIVPVTYLDGNDRVRFLNGQPTDHGDRDGMSVFASFESRTRKSEIDSAGNAAVQLGQVFSTGLAAQKVTRGYFCRQSPGECTSEKKEEDAKKESAKREAAAREAARKEEAKKKALADAGKDLTDTKETKSALAESTVTSDVDKGRYQEPLLFARTDVIGIDIGGSLAQQGLQFVLGYNERSIALIPTTTRNTKGDVTSIMGTDKVGDGAPALDAFSVLGQFQANTETRRLGFGLERYFATGFAARNLGESLGAAIANAKPPLTASQPPAAESATSVAKSF